MKKFNLIILTVLFLAFSCNKKDSKNIIFNQKFPISKKIKGIPVSKISQPTPFRISIIDSILMVNDWDQNPRIHFYNKNSLKKIAEYGFLGKGPFDFTNPECSFNFYKHKGENRFIIYELGSGLIYEISFDSILMNRDKNILSPNEKAILRKRFLPPNLVGSDYVKKIDNYLVGEALSDKSIKYFKIDFDDFKNIQSQGEVYKSTFLNKVSPPYKSYVDRSYLSYSKDNKKYVAAYYLLNRIQILDYNFNVIKQINYGNEKEPNTIEPFSKLNINYFGFSYAGKEKFYVMYNGKKSEGLKNRLKPKEIHVFRYNGKPIAKYILDNDILNFTVDEENNFLYIITENENTPIFKYILDE